jgi:tetratricopeptide (TPR) repeat protein
MKPLAKLLAGLFVLAFAAGCSVTAGPSGNTDPFRQKAEALERDGALRQALETWKVVLTASPGDATARQRRDQLEAQIAQQVDERMKLAERAVERKSMVEARRHYLAVLALDPNHGAAFDALRSRTREVVTLSHTVRQGDTFTALAEAYYGDRSRADVLWDTNNLQPSARLAAGTVLMIPEIPGVPFAHQRAAKNIPAPATAAPSAATEPPVAVAQYANPLLANAREALGSGDFDSAMVSVDRYLATNPRSAEGLEVKRNTLYQMGRWLLGQKKFTDSMNAFDQLARLAPNYQESNRYSAEARNGAVQENYSEGVRLFREEKLREAVTRWRTVLKIEPKHANARKNIEQAERMLQNLQTQQQKNTK